MMKPNHRFTSKTALSALLLGLCLAPTVANAVGSGDHQKARSAYEQSMVLYSQKRYEEAKQIMLELWAQNRSYDVATALGQSELKLGHYADAARYFAFAVAHCPPTEQTKQQEGMQRLLGESQKHVLTLQLKANVTGASVTVDGVDWGTTPLESDIYLDPGLHIITVRKDGYVTADRKLNAAAGTTDTWEVTMQPDATKSMVAAGNASAGANVNPFQESPHDGAASKPNPWILVGGGVVTAGAVVAGLVFSSKASSAKDDADRRRSDIAPGACIGPRTGQSDACAELFDYADKSDRFSTYSTIGFVAAGVVAGGTLAYWFWPRKQAASAANRVTVDGSVARNSGALWLTTNF
ncbi:MAG: PEGA domain-containing protein [Polyangiaceae bacterium]